MSGWAAFLRQREHAQRCDQWVRGKQQEIPDRKSSDEMPDAGGVYMPTGQSGATTEYADLAGRSPGNYAGLIVRTLAQTCYTDGVFRPGQQPRTVLRSWQRWQENGFDAWQAPLYRAAFGQGVAYVLSLPGRSPLTGDQTSVWRGKSAIRMAAFYDNEAGDEFPIFAIEGEIISVEDSKGNPHDVWQVQLHDETDTHYLECDGTGFEKKEWTWISRDAHNSGVCPVVRYAGLLDLDGNAMGEVEPVIPLLRRIDQDVFDRLIVQRFGAWKVRYATGLAKPTTDVEKRAQEALLKMGDLLVNTSDKGKFGTLDATEIKGFIEAHDVDLRDLSALTQMPPYQFLGLTSNLQSEALETAKDGLNKRSFEYRTAFGESHETLFRLSSKQVGDLEEMRAFDTQVRWRDMETRSWASAADALAKFADSVGIPQEMVFEMVPGWTDIDVQRALMLVESQGIETLLDAVERQTRTQEPEVV